MILIILFEKLVELLANLNIFVIFISKSEKKNFFYFFLQMLIL